MKTQHFLSAGLLPLLAFGLQFSFAFGGGTIMGQVLDPDTKKPVSDAIIILRNQGNEKIYFTNDNGYYNAGNLTTGIYDIQVSYLSNKAITTGIKIGTDDVKIIDLKLSVTVGMTEVPITDYKIPLIDPIEPTSGKLDRKTIKDMPILKVADIAKTLNKMVAVNGEYHVAGAREGGLVYYIDGIRVMGHPDIALCGLDTYRSYTGFIPPKYGDTVGGVVVMETRNYFGEQTGN